MNAPFASTVAAAFGCVKAVLTSADIPYNAGSTRPATVTAPYGSLLNPKPPAAVRARMTATNRAFSAAMKALAWAVPEKVIATGFDTTTGPYLSRRGEAGYKVYHEVIGGGYGASARADGCSGVDGPLGNCSNVPVESLDMDFDFFRVREYSLRDIALAVVDLAQPRPPGQARGGVIGRAGGCRTAAAIGVRHARGGQRDGSGWVGCDRGA